MWNIHDFLELFIESSKLVEISDNFGKYQLGLPTDISAQKFHRQHCATQQLPNGFDLGGHHPKHLGNCAVDPGRADQIEGLVVYLERFAHFFRAEFFCKRAFEIMNSETKAEHAGFRVTTEALYTHYTAERLARGDPFAEEMADTLVEECYDEWFTELDIPKVQDFFSWLGVVERPAAGALEQVAASEEETIAEIIAREPVHTPAGRGSAAGMPSLESYGEWTRPDEEQMRSMVEVLGKRDASQCPACGVVIMKASGDDTMMCGCEARPAGGTMDKALRGGGCGHEFKFRSGQPLGQGSLGKPVNARQWKFQQSGGDGAPSRGANDSNFLYV